jgi:uncharacterized protein (TIGR00725 family)
MKITLGVMGSSTEEDPAIRQSAFQIGEQIAERGAVLITGATTGLPLDAAAGAKKKGGEVIGFSPAHNEAEHAKMGLPLTDHDLIIYTGLGFKGRNLLNVRASSGLTFVGGSMGALNEFTIAYDEHKVIGILSGSGGFCDQLQDWMEHLKKPANQAVIHYSPDPKTLLSQVFESIYRRHRHLE